MSEPKRNKIDENDHSEKGRRIRSATTNRTEGGSLTENNDGEFTVDILPPEVWMQIFKMLEAPNLVKCWNPQSTCVWTRILQSDDFFYKMTLHMVLAHLNQSDLLKCCLVSKPWNATVDAYLRQAERDFENESAVHPDRDFELTLDSSNMPDFINTFGLSTNTSVKKMAVNPVPFRRVLVQIQQAKRKDHAFFVAQTNLLTKCFQYYGYLTRILRVEIKFANSSFVDKLKLILSCLEKTPKLRVLKVPAVTLSKKEVSAVEQEALKAFTLDNFWPDLKNLKALWFTHLTRSEFFPVALAYCSQLVYLAFNFALIKPHLPLTVKFPCLTRIIFQFVDSIDEMEFAAFVNSIQCPLKQLTFEIADGVRVVGGSFNGLLMAVNAVSASLEMLVFSRCMNQGIGFDFNINVLNKMRLPSLKELELFDIFGYPSLHFLKSVCPAIEQLTVQPPLPEHWSRINRAGKMYCDLYSKNTFWNELSHILRVDVDCMSGEIPGEVVRNIYTRAGYDAHVTKDLAINTCGDNQLSTVGMGSGVLVTRSKTAYIRY